jgi:hypothetical protein
MSVTQQKREFKTIQSYYSKINGDEFSVLSTLTKLVGFYALFVSEIEMTN